MMALSADAHLLHVDPLVGPVQCRWFGGRTVVGQAATRKQSQPSRRLLRQGSRGRFSLLEAIQGRQGGPIQRV